MSNRSQTHNVRIVGPGAHTGEYGPEHDMVRFTAFNGTALPAWLQDETTYFNYGIAGEYHCEALIDPAQSIVTNHTLQLKAKLQSTTGIVGHDRLLNGANVTYANWVTGEVVSIADEFAVNQAVEWYARWDIQEGFTPMLWLDIAGAPLDEIHAPMYAPFYQFAMATAHLNRYRYSFIGPAGAEFPSDSNMGQIDSQMQDWNRHRLEYRGDGIMHFFLNGTDVWQSDPSQNHSPSDTFRVRMGMQVGGVGRHSGYASTSGTPIPTADLNTSFPPSLMEISHVKLKNIAKVIPVTATLTGLGALSAAATGTTPVTATVTLSGAGVLSATATVTAGNTTWPVLTLDPTGNTVPPHSVTPPVTNVVYVSPSTGGPGGVGNNANAGTRAAPLATFDAAIAKIPSNTAGWTIVMRAGSYTQRSASGGSLSNKLFTCMSEPGEQVWFDGGMQTGWNTFGTFTSATVAGTIKWKGIGWRNWKTGGEPGTLSGFSYPGTNWQGNQGNCIVYLSGGNGGCIHILEDCAFTKTNGVGFSYTEPHDGSRFERVVICDHGSAGINGTGSVRKVPGSPTVSYDAVNPVNNLIIKDCYVARCNTSNFGIAFEAGMKLHQHKGITVDGCVFEDINYNNVDCHNVDTGAVQGAYGAGLWIDVVNEDVTIVNNFARRCTRSGLFFEINLAGTDNVMANNLVIDCGKSSQDHAGIRIACPNVDLWHNTVGYNSSWPFEIYDDIRSPSSYAAGTGGDPAPDTRDIRMANNLFSGELPTDKGEPDNGWTWLGYAYNQGQQTSGTSTNPDQFWVAPNGRWGKNAWWKGPRTNLFRVTGTSGTNKVYATFTGGTSNLHDDHPTMAGNGDLVLASSPYVNPGARDMRVLAGSAAHAAGEPLPANVSAKLVGRVPSATTGATLDMGYIDVPIPTWAPLGPG